METIVPKMHPLVKTAAELRKSIQRLEIFATNFPEVPEVKDGAVSGLLEKLREARREIPKAYLDADLSS